MAEQKEKNTYMIPSGPSKGIVLYTFPGTRKGKLWMIKKGGFCIPIQQVPGKHELRIEQPTVASFRLMEAKDGSFFIRPELRTQPADIPLFINKKCFGKSLGLEIQKLIDSGKIGQAPSIGMDPNLSEMVEMTIEDVESSEIE